MCGIAGVMMRRGGAPESSLLDRLAAALTHRGPDGTGRYMHGTVGLLNTRLAIIDLKHGDQPFEDAGAVLVANGEIYNDPEIRKRLADASYKTGSDCESPLHLYRRLGLDFANELRGMYSIAIHDQKTGELILTRDPFGIKQLYYVITPTHFAFASEPQALIAAGLAPNSLKPQASAELLQLKFTTGAETIFSEIHRLLPGETIVVNDGAISKRLRRHALPRPKAKPIRHTEALRKLDEILTGSVSLHVRSDVPYGLFLSGGIDSSVLACLMSRISATPITAFTAAFPDSGAKDESEAAMRVAQAVGAEHALVKVAKEDFWNYAPRLAQALDDPTTDAAALPTFMLAKAAREKNIKVVLCGEGADEIFGGYSRYRRAGWMWGLWKRKSRTRGVFSPEADGHASFRGWRDGLARAEKQEANGAWSHMQSLQALDCAEWLPNDLLVKLDRCLMAHGVEGRTPFVDPVVAEFGFGLPAEMKVRGRFGKWLLRDWLDRNLPASQAWAKKKGFNPPAGEWIASYKATLEPLVLAQPGIAQLAIGDIVKQVFSEPVKHHQAAWSLVFYALWHSHHVLGVASDGTIGEVLTTAAHSS